MDNSKRWWLWEYIGQGKVGYEEVLGYQCYDGSARCTEVRLVPVEDDGLVTLRVPPDSLEAAIAGARKGEHWEDENGIGLELARQSFAKWHRVEEPLKCPACGSTNCDTEFDHKWQAACYECGVRGPLKKTEPEACEAFRRMGRCEK